MKRFFCTLALLIFLPVSAFSAEPPPAHDVFSAKAVVFDPNTLLLNFEIKPGFFLYQNRLKLTQPTTDFFETAPIKYPKHTIKTDGFNKKIPIYRKKLKLPIHIIGRHPGESVLTLQYQGCSDDGFCYPPEMLDIKLTINTKLELSEAKLIAPLPQPMVKAQPKSFTSSHFEGHHPAMTLLIFLGLGLLLSFTPCVLPMIPVLSGILAGHGKSLSTQKAFLLSLSYVLSMALTYAVIGALIARIGQNLQVLLQSPLSITLFSVLFVLLSLSMFGVYELKLPTTWQSKLAKASYSQATGHYLGAAMMGMLSTLILSPCVTAPLIGALGYIAQTGDVLLGVSALFCLGFGMGIPLLLIGTSLGRILPRTGAWMNTVKQLFGLMLLGVAVYLMSRIISPFVAMLLWGGLFIFAGLNLGALQKASSQIMRLLRVIGIMLLAYGLLILLGAALGNTNPVKPLTGSKGYSQHMATRVTTLKSLEDLMQKAKLEHKAVVLDFYADWCTACKVIEAQMLLNPKVQAALESVLLIKVDLTANNAETHALLAEFNVIAPPTFLFFDQNGTKREDLRLFGEITAPEFISHIQILQE